MSGGYAYGGARVLVELHERHLREFLRVWKEAAAARVRLPETADLNYASLEALLAHVLGCSARYLTWICEQIGVESPELEERPPAARLAGRADEYLEEVLSAWRGPLGTLTEAAAYQPAYESRWGTPYCIDAMLEHAVMHPIRHTEQLKRLLEERS